MWSYSGEDPRRYTHTLTCWLLLGRVTRTASDCGAGGGGNTLVHVGGRPPVVPGRPPVVLGGAVTVGGDVAVL